MNKLINLLIVFWLGSLMLHAQTNTDSIANHDLYQAYCNVQKMASPQLQQNGFQTFLNYASKGHLKAMNLLAYLYEQGIGTAQDKEKAIYWYKKAAESDYLPSLINLARSYKRQADFSKAYEYACRLADLEHPAGYYMKGYSLYKGLAGEQNYAKAFAEFEKGGRLNERYCLYMAGICYRNGYGVDRDLDKASELLQRSKKLGDMHSLQELVTEEPENPIEPIQLEDDGITDFPNISNVPAVNHTILSNQESGVYQGNLITYDWSGKHLLNIVPLSMELLVSGNNITGQWLEGGKDGISIEGIQTDSCIWFKHMEYDKKERELHNAELEWIFKSASINTYQIGDVRYLCGIVRQYTPQLAEYSRPMYLLLSNQKLTEHPEEHPVSIFPNSFESDLIISLETTKVEDVTIFIHTFTGNPVYRKIIKNVPSGKNYYTIHTAFPSGQYIVDVVYGEKKISYPIQKK